MIGFVWISDQKSAVFFHKYNSVEKSTNEKKLELSYYHCTCLLIRIKFLFYTLHLNAYVMRCTLVFNRKKLSNLHQLWLPVPLILERILFEHTVVVGEKQIGYVRPPFRIDQSPRTRIGPVVVYRDEPLQTNTTVSEIDFGV